MVDWLRGHLEEATWLNCLLKRCVCQGITHVGVQEEDRSKRQQGWWGLFLRWGQGRGKRLESILCGQGLRTDAQDMTNWERE